MRAGVLAGYGAVALVCLAVGCGGGGSDSTPSPSPTPTPTPPATAAATIDIVGQQGAQSFNPNPAAPPQPRTVGWHNADTVVHRIVANDGSFDTGNVAPGGTSTALTIGANGMNYHCSIHPSMIGVVAAASGTAPPCTGIYC
jgi:plastocyanin